MKSRPNITRPAIHALLWFLLFFLNYFILKNYSIRFHVGFNILIWITYMIIFYVTYYLLMPFFFRKRIFIFIILSLGLLIGGFFAKDTIGKNHFKNIVAQRIKEKQNTSETRKKIPAFVKKNKGMAERRRIIFSSYGLVLFYMLAFLIRFIQKWQDDEKQRNELEKEKISNELSFLKQQINPHFLFNSLNSIYSLSISQSELTSNAILKLSAILRYVLYETENELVPLENELKVINNYIELQKLRQTEKVTVNYTVEKETGKPGVPDKTYETGEPAVIGEKGETDEPNVFKIEPLILLPPVENAFKHGADNVNKSFIDIRIIIVGNKLEMKVSNSIVTHSSDKTKDSGIGIKNLKRRLELLYPDEHEFEISEKDGIFRVRLLLQLKK